MRIYTFLAAIAAVTAVAAELAQVVIHFVQKVRALSTLNEKTTPHCIEEQSHL